MRPPTRPLSVLKVRRFAAFSCAKSTVKYLRQRALSAKRSFIDRAVPEFLIFLRAEWMGERRACRVIHADRKTVCCRATRDDDLFEKLGRRSGCEGAPKARRLFAGAWASSGLTLKMLTSSASTNALWRSIWWERPCTGLEVPVVSPVRERGLAYCGRKSARPVVIAVP